MKSPYLVSFNYNRQIQTQMTRIRMKAMIIAAAVIVGFSALDADAQNRRNRDKKAETPPATEAPSKPAANKNGIKPYKDVITAEAVTDNGMFDVHYVDKKYFYEIPVNLLGRDMLMVSRIAKTATGIGYGGEQINSQVLRWERLKDDKITLREISYQNVANDSLPISTSVKNSNFEPIVGIFDIKAFGDGKETIVIDVSDLLEKDTRPLGMPSRARTQYKVTSLDGSRSFVEFVKSFPENIELRHVKTYNASGAPSNSSNNSISIEINNSMLLLPAVPMMPRIADQRVGWFTTRQVDFGLDEQKAETRRYLDRWRLEIKPGDEEKFKRGELVEPVKPIIFYIDPATPEKWIPYLKQGVDDWQVAFEAAGFKNAIYALDPPTPEENPEWDVDDSRYSVIRYFASDIQNAYGPHVSDPRSGEIMESHIGWYHNVMNLVRNWYFIQTAAVNPEARSVKFKDEVMGDLIRFVSSHEVGHTLGLPHNFSASNAYPVDSLRSTTFTKDRGTAPSIMDYARFNYIAQPGDDVNLLAKIGEYDEFSVSWGYRPILDANTPEEEVATLNQWILDKKGGAAYRYGRQGNPNDPSAQSEDLGDDAMKASTYGIANLKRIVPNLIEWTQEEGKNYGDLEEMYGQVAGQYSRYMGHVRTNIGGVYEVYKTYDEDGAVYTHASKDTQKRAMTFLNEQLFKTPSWMIDKDIISKIQDFGIQERVRGLQTGTLNSILEPRRLGRVIENQTLNGASAYTITELYADLRSGIWSELSNGTTVDPYRRALQRAHVERLETLLKAVDAGGFGASINTSQSDIPAISRAELKTLQTNLRNSRASFGDRMSQIHVDDLIVRIDNILDPK